MINKLTCLYEEVIEACQSQPNDFAAEATAVALFLNWASLNHQSRVKEQARKYRLGHIFKRSWSSVSKQACKLLRYNRAA
ncbi:MAG: hypothetical protein COA78_16680 [Blastopirellula sp.]|nr:MAG: hypothetical protein COA78_16680 [Blastopirellula sp.]